MRDARLVNYASVIVAVLVYFYLGWVVLPPAPAGFAWDDAWYLWMAEWFSGRRDHLPIAFEMMKLRQYPPLFPYLVSMTGDVLSDFSLALRMNAMLLALSSVLVLRWLVGEGLKWPLALPCALLVVLNPVALEFSSLLQSEPLFLFLTTLALAMAASEKESGLRWAWIGLLAGLAIATRSAGWALAIAVLAQNVWGGRYRLLWHCIAGLVLGLLFMAYLNAGLPDAHTYAQGFLDNIRRMDAAYLAAHLRGMYSGWASIWGGSVGALLILAWVLPGLLQRSRRMRADALYVLISLAMLVAWPFPGQMGRFLWMLLPAAFVAGAATTQLVHVKRSRTAATGALVFLSLALTVPDGIGRFTSRLLSPPGGEERPLSRMSDWSMAPDRETGIMNLRVNRLLLEDVRKIAQETTKADCIYSEYPALVSIQARRVSLASPWNRIEDMGLHPLQCSYYYLVPDALPGTSSQAARELAAQHQELFRSLAPYDAEGKRLLGVFLRLKPAIH